MLIGAAAARRQSVAHWGLELAAALLCRDLAGKAAAKRLEAQLLVGLAGFLDFFALALTGFRAVAGLMLIGLPAGRAAASLGSGSGRKKARQPGERRDLLRIMQTVTRSTSGISGPQN